MENSRSDEAIASSPAPSASEPGLNASRPDLEGPKPAPVIRLDGYWPYQVTVLADRISRRTARMVRAHGGLNLSQWRVLAAVAEQPGRRSAEVVEITPMDKGIVSRATKTLLMLGLLIRVASQVDGRVSHLHLTAKGLDLYRSLIPHVSGVIESAGTSLTTAEQAQLSGLLTRLLHVIPDPR